MKRKFLFKYFRDNLFSFSLKKRVAKRYKYSNNKKNHKLIENVKKLDFLEVRFYTYFPYTCRTVSRTASIGQPGQDTRDRAGTKQIRQGQDKTNRTGPGQNK
jgi:hypothetical protein